MGQAQETLKHSPLEPEHRALQAKMGPFAGWYMPIEYAGTLAEHRSVREAVGLFDLTHLGKVFLEGPGSLDLLQHAFTNDVSRVATGGAQYNLCLNDDGGIVDDVIVYRVGDERYLVVPNAANRDRVHALMEESGRALGADALATVEDWVLLAPQGPRSTELVTQVFSEAGELAYMHCYETRYRGVPALVSRSGYTGEVGYELVLPADTAGPLWNELLERGAPLAIQPCGLGARDTLRLEMGYPLHGNDISEAVTPLQAALSWAVFFDKGEFRGADALRRQKEQGIPDRLWGLRVVGKGIPRAHMAVHADGERVGETTSGTFSPTLRIGIAMAYLPRERFGVGDRVEIDVRGRRIEAEVVKPPFVESSPK